MIENYETMVKIDHGPSSSWHETTCRLVLDYFFMFKHILQSKFQVSTSQFCFSIIIEHSIKPFQVVGSWTEISQAWYKQTQFKSSWNLIGLQNLLVVFSEFMFSCGKFYTRSHLRNTTLLLDGLGTDSKTPAKFKLTKFKCILLIPSLNTYK